DEHVERWARLEARHQSDEPWTAREFRTADSVVDEDVLFVQRPALDGHELADMTALELDGCLVNGHAVLFGALAKIRGGDHDRPRLPASTAWRSSHSATASRTSSAIDQLRS